MGNNVSWRSLSVQHCVMLLTMCIFGIILVFSGGASADGTGEDAALAPADLVYSTYLGDISLDSCQDLKLFYGSAAVVGYTRSTNFPVTSGAYDTTFNASNPYHDTFVAMIDPDGLRLIFATYLGGSGDDYGYGISIDDRSYIYVSGQTNSANFPAVPGSFDTTYNGGTDAFVALLLPDGSDLVYSTFLGGSDGDHSNTIEVASGYRAVTAGYTSSSDFPTLGGWDKTYNGNGDCFVTVLNADGSAIVKSTFIGGSNYEYISDLVLDSSDNLRVTGSTYSSDFPTTSTSFDKIFHGGLDDGFLFCMNPFTQSIQGSTYFGGSGNDQGNSIAMGIDPSYVYITGSTSSTDFPTLNAYDGTYNGSYDAFVVKFSSDGKNLVNSTFLGGPGEDHGGGIAADNEGNAYVIGFTESITFPVTGGTAFDKTHNGLTDVFCSLLHIDSGMSLHYSTFLGGSSHDYGYAIDINGSYETYLAGHTFSANFPVVTGNFDTTYNGDADGFISKLSIPDLQVDFNLCQGLNLISCPYNDGSLTNADALLNSICPGNADSIWKYDCSTKIFTSWTILDPGDGWAVSPGMPVWVNITNPAGCTWVPPGTTPSGISYTNCVGLNLVTVPVYTHSITIASEMMFDIPSCTAIYRYKKEVSCSNPGGFEGYFNISPPSDDFAVLRGHAYWASTTTAGTWTPPNP